MRLVSAIEVPSPFFTTATVEDAGAVTESIRPGMQTPRSLGPFGSETTDFYEGDRVD